MPMKKTNISQNGSSIKDNNKKQQDEEESFKMFQGKILDEYNHMVSEFGLTVIDATQPIRTQQRQMREIVSRYLKEKLKEKAVLAK